jgi:hypothetical protein
VRVSTLGNTKCREKETTRLRQIFIVFEEHLHSRKLHNLCNGKFNIYAHEGGQGKYASRSKLTISFECFRYSSYICCVNLADLLTSYVFLSLSLFLSLDTYDRLVLMRDPMQRSVDFARYDLLIDA